MESDIRAEWNLETTVTGDTGLGAAYIPLTSGERVGIAHHVERLFTDNGDIHLDFDRNGNLIGIELLGFKFGLCSHSRIQ